MIIFFTFVFLFLALVFLFLAYYNGWCFLLVISCIVFSILIAQSDRSHKGLNIYEAHQKGVIVGYVPHKYFALDTQSTYITKDCTYTGGKASHQVCGNSYLKEQVLKFNIGNTEPQVIKSYENSSLVDIIYSCAEKCEESDNVGNCCVAQQITNIKGNQ